jgi:hypothetical protein
MQIMAKTISRVLTQAILPLQRANFPSSVQLHSFEVAALAPSGQQSVELVDAGL